ncbi:MAG: molybdate ABC transporter substrate-binding protein [Chloroflexota bacterium]
MKKGLAFAFALMLAACNLVPTASTGARTLTVFAAASLTDAFTEIGSAFESAHPGVAVTFNFAGSQTLRAQIEEGAPADVFASANQKEMDALVNEGLAEPGAPQVFLTNQLVVVLPDDNPADIQSLEDLARPGIKLVLAAEEVPVGNYTRQALELMNAQFGANFKESVLANVASNEDTVRQVVTKVQLGEADAGIVYTSDGAAAPDLGRIEIPTEFNIVARYPIAPLANAADPELADEFIAFVLSEEGQSILAKWGFGPPR